MISGAVSPVAPPFEIKSLKRGDEGIKKSTLPYTAGCLKNYYCRNN